MTATIGPMQFSKSIIQEFNLNGVDEGGPKRANLTDSFFFLLSDAFSFCMYSVGLLVV